MSKQPSEPLPPHRPVDLGIILCERDGKRWPCPASAVERVKAYIDARSRMPGLDRDEINGVMVTAEEGPHSLTLSDLREVVRLAETAGNAPQGTAVVMLSWAPIDGAMFTVGSRRSAIDLAWRQVPPDERTPVRRRLIIALVDHVREYYDRTGKLAPPSEDATSDRT